jgi:hypothetical protein
LHGAAGHDLIGVRQCLSTRGVLMNLEKVVFGFFVVLAATLNFGFFIGDIADPRLHNVYELFAAVVVNLIATVLKFGDRTQIGAVHLSTSLVADLQLISPHDRERRLVVGWGAAGEHRVRRAARGRDRVVPPPVTGRWPIPSPSSGG